MDLVVPRYTYEEIRFKADQALEEHHSTKSIPIPVETIVEFEYEITIVPIPGLYQLYSIDAFMGRSQDTIHIDRGVFEHRSPYRYRFSLAHELGHVELHRDVFRQLQFSDVQQWKTALHRLPEHQRSLLEFQAYDFAGLFLVPKEPLQRKLQQCLKTLERTAEIKNLDFDVQVNSDLAKPYICTRLGKEFEVSDQVIERRLFREGLWPP